MTTDDVCDMVLSALRPLLRLEGSPPSECLSFLHTPSLVRSSVRLSAPFPPHPAPKKRTRKRRPNTLQTPHVNSRGHPCPTKSKESGSGGGWVGGLRSGEGELTIGAMRRCPSVWCDMMFARAMVVLLRSGGCPKR